MKLEASSSTSSFTLYVILCLSKVELHSLMGLRKVHLTLASAQSTKLHHHHVTENVHTPHTHYRKRVALLCILV